MSRELHPATPEPASQQARDRVLPPRLLPSILLGAGITILLICIETLLIWLRETSQHTLPRTANSLPTLLVALFHTPLFLLATIAEVVVFSLLLWLFIRPRALTNYLRIVKNAQEPDARRYVSLALASPEVGAASHQFQHTPAISSTQQERLPVLDLLQQDAHVLLLGNAGMGKSMALHAYAHLNAQDERRQPRAGERIPLYVPLPRYAHYLKTHLPALPEDGEAAPPSTLLLDFLRQSDLSGMHALRSSLNRLSQRGNLHLLCDGLDETDVDYQPLIVAELVEMMRQGANRIVLACHEADFQAQPLLAQAVDEGLLSTAVLHDLDAGQMRTFVETSVRTADTSRHYTAGQVMQAIERSRFRYLCENTMLLSCLTEIIGRAGIEQARQIDTRGRLLRAFVTQEIERERDNPAWHSQAPETERVIDVLAQLAYAARWTSNPNALSLSMTGGDQAEVALELQAWLDEHPAPYPFVLSGTEDAELTSPRYDSEELAQLLQFAQGAGLIDRATDGLLSFRHELLAQYFTAEYLFAAASTRGTPSPLREDLLLALELWSGPIALWAGLLDNPFALAELMLRSGRVGGKGNGNTARLALLSSLTLSLLCCGIAEVLPPQGTGKLAPASLPADIERILAQVFANPEAREEL
ncbi:MAG TPA: hypothetical protein VFQ30_07335, partial [Ktedonobacteraceae bacterium]|nr:hypothetical protein [Ktedonobacteraceae bacterium]